MPRGPGKNDATSESDDDVWARAASRRRRRLESHDVCTPCTPPPHQPREQDSSDKFSTSRALFAASAHPSSRIPAFVAPAVEAAHLPTEPMSPMQQKPNQTPAMAGAARPSSRAPAFVAPAAVAVVLPTELMSPMQQQPNQTPAMAGNEAQQPNQTPAMAMPRGRRPIVLVVNPNKKSRMQQQPNQTPAMAAAKEEADFLELFGDDRSSKPVKPLSNPQVGIGGKPEEPPRNPTWAVI